jgi:thioredoxin
MAIITCPKCGAKNRVDEQTAATKQPVCGRCGTKLTLFGESTVTDAHPIDATDANFEKLLHDAGDKPILIDCWAAWCGPCKMLAPTIEAVAREAGGRWLIAKLDTDANQQTAARFNITSIPTMLIFKKGKLVDQLVGLQPKPNIESRLMKYG